MGPRRRSAKRGSGYARNPKPVFPLVTRPQLALALGWNAITISKLEATEGLPVEARGAPGKSTIYSLPTVIAWRIQREVQRRIPERPTGEGAPPLDLDIERARLADAHRRRVELALQQLQGEVAPVAEMAAVVTEMLETTKTRVLALPAALAESVTAVARQDGPRGVERALHEAVTGALQELAAWRPPAPAGAPA